MNGRSEISLKERMKMDIEYMQNESLISDMKFVLKTVLNIFKRDKGAV